MSGSLVSIRKAAGLTQEEAGRRIAKVLRQKVGRSYFQKKIARFETGVALPSEDELRVMGEIYNVDIETLRPLLRRRVLLDAPAAIERLDARRSLIASCILGEPRPQTLAESYEAFKQAVEHKNLSIALFIPYPSTVNLPPSHHLSTLVGYYTRVINSVLASNLSFKKSLSKEKADSVAVYVPKPEMQKSSAVLIPPIFRQYSLTIQETTAQGGLTKNLDVWTPGKAADISRPIKATSVYSLYHHIDAWEAFFGEIIPYWIEKNEFLESEDYWKRIR